MARWILNRPAHECPSSEQRVAELLTPLPDDWVIRWGFWYKDNNDVDREGDFLVLGPDGGLMVIEAKGGSLDYNPRTGRWDTDSGDNPKFQLDGEWKAVLNTIKEAQHDRPGLFVCRALAVPELDLADFLEDYHTIPRKFLLTGPELRRFTKVWHERFSLENAKLSSPARSVFFDTYGKDVTATAIRHFIDSADEALMRQMQCQYELLDQLEENRQFMVQGGTGSGKTWLAFELARRWASLGKGQRVLLLCYNVALATFLKRLTGKPAAIDRAKPGEVEVLYWEELATRMVERAGLSYDIPKEPEARRRFYEVELPELMADVLAGGHCPPEYDALIVDEAQDHDTFMQTPPENLQGPGWWGIYYKLLHHGPRSPIGIFFDVEQRPEFRPVDGFNAETLRKSLLDHPVQVQLTRTLRYSRSILNFLKNLNAEGLQGLVAGLKQKGSLPDGPDVIQKSVPPSQVATTVDAIAREWLDEGFCRPNEILVLSQHSQPGSSVLADVETIAGYPLLPYLDIDMDTEAIGFTSVNKAKGLESLAVIIVDFPPLEDISSPSRQQSFFMGASRARQLLAVVHTTTSQQLPES